MASSRRSAVWLAMLACATLAAALRVPGLQTQSLWIDEIYSVNMTTWPLDMVLRVQDGHPPLFALLHIAVGQWLGPDLAGRAIAATAGVLAVAGLVWLATELWDLRVGIVAGVLLAVSPLHVWYSQEGRSYALLVLIAIVASQALVAGMRGGGWLAWATFGVASLCGFFTHYLYAGLLLAQVIFLALAGGQRRFLAAVGVVAVIGAASLPVLGSEATSFVNDTRRFEWLAVPYAAFAYVGGFGLGPPVEALHRERGLAVVAREWPAVLAVGLVLAGLVLALPGAVRRAGPFGFYVLLWAVVPVAVVLGGSWLRDGAFNVRYAITALPAIVLCFALAMTTGSPRRLVVGLVALVGLSLVSVARDRLDATRFREDMRSTARFLETEVAAADRVVVTARYMRLGVGHYYRGSATLEPLPVLPVRTRDDATQNLRTLAAGPQPTWIVMTREWEDDPAGHLRAALAEGGPHAAVAAQFPGVRIWRVSP